MNRPSRLLLLLLVSVFLGGCGRGWLVGKWVVDREATLQQFSAAAEAPSESVGENFLKEIAAGLRKGASHLILAQFEGLQLEFTPTELRRTRQGVGEAMAYEVIERPADGRLVLRYADGEIVTWSRSPGGIRMRLPGEEDHWIYFQPAPAK